MLLERILPPALIAMSLALPALADDYLVFHPNETRPYMRISSNTAPEPGKTAPAGDKVMVWVMENDESGKLDPEPMHYYYFSTGVRRYMDPPEKEAARPDSAAMQIAVMDDASITAATKLNLVPYFTVLTANQDKPQYIQPIWAGLKLSGRVSLTDIAKIEAYATKYNVPLTQ